jgi:hypothetical protein
MPRPDWKNVDSYNFDPKALSYREYAWEFLRRNPEFQRESEAAFASGSEREKEKVATKFGLRDLFPYMEEYTPGQAELVWLAEALVEPAIVHEDRRRNLIQTRRSGEVALIFDLDATVSTGPAAIDSLLWWARGMLMEERRKYIERLPKDGKRIIRTSTPRIRKAKLFTWLRVYDAVEHMRVPQVEVARVLYPDDFIPNEFTGKDNRSAAKKRVSDDRKRALSLVDNEYLALIAIDYLQDKSKR